VVRSGRNFANGPATRDAACLLRRALHLHTAQAVIADLG